MFGNIRKTGIAAAALAIALLPGSLGVASAQGFEIRVGGGAFSPYSDYNHWRWRHRHRETYGGGYFDEREYLHCNPDVLDAIRRGELSSGWEHYQAIGWSEGRRLRCY